MHWFFVRDGRPHTFLVSFSVEYKFGTLKWVNSEKEQNRIQKEQQQQQQTEEGERRKKKEERRKKKEKEEREKRKKEASIIEM